MRRFRSPILTALPLLALLAVPAAAERGDDADRKSKNGSVRGEVAGVGVEVHFGRPSVRDREIWGALVPHGKVWRTGADEATTISLSRDAVVEGEKLAAGTYGLFTIPGENEWTVIFNRTAEQWGAFDYDAGQDALRVTVEPRTGEHVEAMDFALTDEGLELRWEKRVVPIRIGAGG